MAKLCVLHYAKIVLHCASIELSIHNVSNFTFAKINVCLRLLSMLIPYKLAVHSYIVHFSCGPCTFWLELGMQSTRKGLAM